MKYFLAVLLTALSSIAFSQKNATTVTMTGIGEVKLGMNQTELQKLTGQKFPLKNLANEQDPQPDTVNFIYNDIRYTVILMKDYTNEVSKGFIVYEISSSSPQLKTKSGIGIGDDKMKIIVTYEQYTIDLMPEWNSDFTARSKTKSVAYLHGDESGKKIMFHMENNKVIGFTVLFDEGC